MHSDHHHHHTVTTEGYGHVFIIGILLNSVFITAEIIYGLLANSLALLADAGHNASDVLGLFLAWGAIVLAKRKASERYTYGLQSSSILAALANAVLLLVACGGIAWEAIQRFSQPEITASSTVMAVAGIGIVVNGITAWLFMAGSNSDLNIRGAFLHMAADAAISLGVVLSGAAMQQTGWLWLDSAISLTIALIIIITTWGLLKDAIGLALHAVPKHINIAEVRHYLASHDGVNDVHDLHIWAMSTNETALSAHLLMSRSNAGDKFLHQLADELEERFHIGHSTIQIEHGSVNDTCKLAGLH